MPLPRWLGQINKRTFNKLELKRGKRPVLTHVGRASGNTYRTPLDAHAVEGGFIFFPLYGPRTDWVRNVMAAGKARLDAGGETYALDSPRTVSPAEALPLLPEGTKVPVKSVTELLRMDVSS